MNAMMFKPFLQMKSAEFEQWLIWQAEVQLPVLSPLSTAPLVACISCESGVAKHQTDNQKGQKSSQITKGNTGNQPAAWDPGGRETLDNF